MFCEIPAFLICITRTKNSHTPTHFDLFSFEQNAVPPMNVESLTRGLALVDAEFMRILEATVSATLAPLNHPIKVEKCRFRADIPAVWLFCLAVFAWLYVLPIPRWLQLVFMVAHIVYWGYYLQQGTDWSCWCTSEQFLRDKTLISDVLQHRLASSTLWSSRVAHPLTPLWRLVSPCIRTLLRTRLASMSILVLAIAFLGIYRAMIIGWCFTWVLAPIYVREAAINCIMSLVG